MGTLQFAERPDSRSWERAKQGDESTFEFRTRVTWVPADSVDEFPGWAWLQAQEGIPQPRTRLPEDIHENDAFLKVMVCRSVRAKQVTSQPYCMDFEARYSTFLSGDGKAFVRITRTMGGRNTPMYRLGATRPADGDATWPPTTDMGGTKVDIYGVARPYTVPQQIITMEIFWDRTQVVDSSPLAEPPVSLLDDYCETRNDAPLFDQPTGKLLFKGFSSSPMDELYVLHMVWIADQWSHLEQFPVPNPGGGPFLGSVSSFSGVTVKQCSNVVWLQRYPNKTDHTAMFGSSAWAAILAEMAAPEPEAVA